MMTTRKNMTEKLEAETEADATKKACCDKELAENNTKKDDKTAEIDECHYPGAGHLQGRRERFG